MPDRKNSLGEYGEEMERGFQEMIAFLYLLFCSIFVTVGAAVLILISMIRNR